MLRLDKVSAAYGAVTALRDADIDGRGGRDRRAHRFERRGQVDNAEDHLGPGPAVGRNDRISRRGHHRAVARGHRRARHHPGARRPPDLSAADGAAEPCRGGLLAARARQGKVDARAGVRAVSPALRTAPAARGIAQRRRAADAGLRACDDGATGAPPARRAVARPGADRCRGSGKGHRAFSRPTA